MLFNSWLFVVFFLLFYAGYVLLMKRHRAQNLWLLAASYIFYGKWDYRFLFLLLLSTVIDYVCSLLIDRSTGTKRRGFLVASLASNLTILGFFKYYNFFAESFATLTAAFGWHVDPMLLHVVLPVGVSFYTFQSMSYTIDVYRGEVKPPARFLDFALYVAFFPQLVAGPIERGKHLLPQVLAPRRPTSTDLELGMFLIAWGFFKKVVVADNLGEVANQVFSNYTQYHGLSTILGALAFGIQIYTDFSGYSDIARGLARLLGFSLILNFNLPYFARNPSEFWSRWHISLSSWLRDYLYIPLGGNRHGTFNTCRNLMLTMLLGGLWHGAAWNFLIWGGYHGLLLLIHRLTQGSAMMGERFFPSRLLTGVKIFMMFALTNIGWLFFRCRSLDQILYMLKSISLRMDPHTLELALPFFLFLLPLLAVECVLYAKSDLLWFAKLRIPQQALFYAALVIIMCLFGARQSIEFIYFQF